MDFSLAYFIFLYSENMPYKYVVSDNVLSYLLLQTCYCKRAEEVTGVLAVPIMSDNEYQKRVCVAGVIAELLMWCTFFFLHDPSVSLVYKGKPDTQTTSLSRLDSPTDLSTMRVIIFLPVLAALSFTRVTAAPLPCDSQLRLIFPHLFRHCSDCSYTEWSAWEMVEYDAPTSQCPSGKAFVERRTRAISSGEACTEPLTENKPAVCEDPFYAHSAFFVVNPLYNC